MDDLKSLMEEMGLLGPLGDGDVLSLRKECSGCEPSCQDNCSAGCTPSNQPGGNG